MKEETLMNYNENQEDAVIVQALDILRRRMKTSGYCFQSPDAVKNYLRLLLGNQPIERFLVYFLDTQNCLIAAEIVAEGTIDSAAIYPREIVKLALQHNASAVILAHNHPSGSCLQSQADIKITEKLKDAFSLFDIRVLDHIIVGGMDTLSFAERGLI